jgi:hypothetical protein
MKYLAGFYTLIAILTFFLIPQNVFADSSSSTIISSSQSTVCCNGKCTTSDNPNVKVVSHNGSCQILYGSDTSGDSVTAEPTESATNNVTLTPEPTETQAVITSPQPSASPSPTLSPNPTIAQVRKDFNNQVKKEANILKEHMKDQEAALSSLFQTFENFCKGFFR